MEKEYLIHNIDYKDNPEDQHQTIDITISDLEVAGQDITADIGIDTYVNGISTHSSIYEDVSLTGSGGGGVPTAKLKINFFTAGEHDPLPGEVVLININGQMLSDTGFLSGDQQVEPVNNEFECVILNDYKVYELSAVNDSDNEYVWRAGDNAIQIISGSAEIIEDSSFTITGDCEISIELALD